MTIASHALTFDIVSAKMILAFGLVFLTHSIEYPASQCWHETLPETWMMEQRNPAGSIKILVPHYLAVYACDVLLTVVSESDFCRFSASLQMHRAYVGLHTVIDIHFVQPVPLKLPERPARGLCKPDETTRAFEGKIHRFYSVPEEPFAAAAISRAFGADRKVMRLLSTRVSRPLLWRWRFVMCNLLPVPFLCVTLNCRLGRVLPADARNVIERSAANRELPWPHHMSHLGENGLRFSGVASERDDRGRQTARSADGYRVGRPGGRRTGIDREWFVRTRWNPLALNAHSGDDNDDNDACSVASAAGNCRRQINQRTKIFSGLHAIQLNVQEGQHPLTGQRAANFKRDLGAM